MYLTVVTTGVTWVIIAFRTHIKGMVHKHRSKRGMALNSALIRFKVKSLSSQLSGGWM